MKTKVVGISFNPTDNPEITEGVKMKLVHDKENKYSSKAIAVMFGKQLVGHIGEKDNPKHEKIFEILPIKAKVSRLARLQEGEEFAKFTTGQITTLEVDFELADDLEVKSFNEDALIKFIEKTHRYTYKGEQLLSATSYIKRWIKDFEKEKISALYAKSLGVKQEEVLGLWEGGQISADFGTVIHKALEHYEKYKGLGGIIRDKKGGDNKALPSHPVLKEIVWDFLARFTHKDDEVVAEALVTNVELGLCGYIDRILITGDKKCRVQDYKINIGSADESKNNVYLGMMSELPKNKLSKYQMQLSFYARLLELSGWRVEGLDAYVYENEWKHYPMDVLKLDF